MTIYKIDNKEIKESAIAFKQALLDWKNPERIRKSSREKHPERTEEQIIRIINYNAKQVDPVIKAFEPIFRLAIRKQIIAPLKFGSYMMSHVGKILGDELSWPEIRNPYYHMIDVLECGLDYEDFIQTPEYKNNLLPLGYDDVVAEIENEESNSIHEHNYKSTLFPVGYEP